jgi:hypothetical protein
MAAEGFVSLSHPDAGFNLIYRATGLPTFMPPTLADRRADGLLVVFEVSDIDGRRAAAARCVNAGATPGCRERATAPAADAQAWPRRCRRRRVRAGGPRGAGGS